MIEMEQHLDFEKKQKQTLRRGRLLKGLTYFFLTIWALIVLFPFYWMILTSVKSYGSYNAEHVPAFFTLSPTLQNYRDAFTTVPLVGYLLNTLIFALATTAIMVVVSTLGAYAFARLDFRGKNLVFTLFLALMMIPSELVVITNFVTITNMDLRNTFPGLILPSVTSVFYIYLLKENFEQVPDELYRAAKVDGTSDLKYLWKVMIPICRPTIVTIIILKIIECWNSYVWDFNINYSNNHIFFNWIIVFIRVIISLSIKIITAIIINFSYNTMNNNNIVIFISHNLSNFYFFIIISFFNYYYITFIYIRCHTSTCYCYHVVFKIP